MHTGVVYGVAHHGHLARILLGGQHGRCHDIPVQGGRLGLKGRYAHRPLRVLHGLCLLNLNHNVLRAIGVLRSININSGAWRCAFRIRNNNALVGFCFVSGSNAKVFGCFGRYKCRFPRYVLCNFPVNRLALHRIAREQPRIRILLPGRVPVHAAALGRAVGRDCRHVHIKRVRRLVLAAVLPDKFRGRIGRLQEKHVHQDLLALAVPVTQHGRPMPGAGLGLAFHHGRRHRPHRAHGRNHLRPRLLGNAGKPVLNKSL